MERAIVMDTKDNVATALTRIEPKDTVAVVSSSQNKVCEVKANEAIPFGHKLATMAISKGSKVIKYGEVIGYASQDIGLGAYVHVHNMHSGRLQMPRVWYKEEI